jgi:hypothetical protein
MMTVGEYDSLLKIEKDLAEKEKEAYEKQQEEMKNRSRK